MTSSTCAVIEAPPSPITHSQASRENASTLVDGTASSNGLSEARFVKKASTAFSHAITNSDSSLEMQQWCSNCGVTTLITGSTRHSGLCLTMKVNGIDYESLIAQKALCHSFESKFSSSIAAEAGHGTRPKNVHLALTRGHLPGELEINAIFFPLEKSKISDVLSELQTASASAEQQRSGQAAAGIRGVVGSTVNSVDGMELAYSGAFTVTQVSIQGPGGVTWSNT